VEKAPFKVLFSNDTTNIETCISPYHKSGELFNPRMLEAAVDETAGIGVDVHLLQPGQGWVPFWKSRSYPLNEHIRFMKERFGLDPSGDFYARYLAAGGDMVAVFVKRCRGKNLVPFVSLRLNDGHGREFINMPREKIEGWAWYSLCPILTEHPQWRIGDSLNWKERGLNWAIPEVRRFKLAYIQELCEQYDLDGFELDFMRYPSFFRVGETSVEERRRIMADFVSDVRQILDRTAAPGRHRWLCVRIPACLAEHDALGIDVRRFADGGVEMFNLSYYFFTEQQGDYAEIKKILPDAAVYVEMCHATAVGPPLKVASVAGADDFTFRRTTDRQYYTTAHLAYTRGLDGVSVFNFAYYREHGTAGRGPFNEPPFRIFRHLREPRWLTRQPQHYFLSKVWNGNRQLPRCLEPGQTATFVLDMVPPSGGWREKGRLRVQSRTPMQEVCFKATFNGIQLSPADDLSEPYSNSYLPLLGTAETLRGWTVPNVIVKNGVNRIEITMQNGNPVELVFLDLAIC